MSTRSVVTGNSLSSARRQNQSRSYSTSFAVFPNWSDAPVPDHSATGFYPVILALGKQGAAVRNKAGELQPSGDGMPARAQADMWSSNIGGGDAVASLTR